jgi:hypothetical protein
VTDDRRWGPADAVWLEAVAAVQSDIEADVRAEAHEVFMAEAARSRLEDRVGMARILLRCGTWVEGRLGGGERVAGHLVLAGIDDRECVVPIGAVANLLGAAPALRVEGAPGDPTVTSWLREVVVAGEVMRVLDCSGRWWAGPIAFVGADHVDIDDAEHRVTLPVSSVEAWVR